MTGGQAAILLILAATMAVFIWGRWRHDLVAISALLACVAAGLVPGAEAFAGFGHPAVITVACVLVLSHALQTTGAVDALTRVVLPRQAGPATTIAALSGLAALLSGFMNNVGALALLMPLAAETARRQQLPAGVVLMPVAFGSILGGMTTLIGTPPNLIVASFRESAGSESFAMFDFTPVGLVVALSGLAFIVTIGWHLVPRRARSGPETFETGAYVTEARVPDGAKAAGLTLREIETELGEMEAQVVGLVRADRIIPAPHPYREVRAGDILVIEADPKALATALSALGLQLEASRKPAAPSGESANGESEPDDAQAAPAKPLLQSEDVVLMELAVRPRAEIVGRSARGLALRTRYGINLLALSREGRHSTTRLRSTTVREGDVLLVQGPVEAIQEFAHRYGCIPLAERELRIPEPGKALTASAIMAAAIGCAAAGFAPAAVAFAAGVLALVLSGVVSARRLYDAIDWPVIVLLAALIPVAGAMSTTGTAELIARQLTGSFAGSSPVLALVLVLVVTMTLSDFMNNAATAAVMCPVAIGIANQLGVNADAFLMAVAVGASCAFLTPIGHQNNTLILGPGGFRFGDYWQLGLPLEILICIVAVPMLLWVWPL
jgi:di/tricarboxylate transporter